MSALSLQLPDRIIIYELTGRAGEGAAAKAEGGSAPGAAGVQEFDLRYRVRDKIIAQLECNLLVVTSFHVILCQERKLQLYDFAGRKTRCVCSCVCCLIVSSTTMEWFSPSSAS